MRLLLNIEFALCYISGIRIGVEYCIFGKFCNHDLNKEYFLEKAKKKNLSHTL